MGRVPRYNTTTLAQHGEVTWPLLASSQRKQRRTERLPSPPEVKHGFEVLGIGPRVLQGQEQVGGCHEGNGNSQVKAAARAMGITRWRLLRGQWE
jgi:hypothetical protein